MKKKLTFGLEQPSVEQIAQETNSTSNSNRAEEQKRLKVEVSNDAKAQTNSQGSGRALKLQKQLVTVKMTEADRKIDDVSRNLVDKHSSAPSSAA